MGLADRFKKSLESKDIFKSIEDNAKTVTVNYISNPISKKSNYEDLETEIISKIRNTPYWDEYSPVKQMKMIESYFCNKQKDSHYTQSQKEEFIQDVLILSNNK